MNGCFALQEIEDITRTMLLYCSKCYNGDERIKSFIWDLITPPNELGKVGAGGDVEDRMSNHMGLNNPVPRGRRRKKPQAANAAAAAAAAAGGAVLGGDEDSLTGELNGGVTTSNAASGGGAGEGGGEAKPPAGDWLALYDHHLLEEGYKRHLLRHANK